MKVRASVKKMCRNCRIIRRNGSVRVICIPNLGISKDRAKETDYGQTSGSEHSR